MGTLTALATHGTSTMPYPRATTGTPLNSLQAAPPPAHTPAHVEMFERFLATKFPASKRFGLEGTESIIPALHHFCQESARRGVVQLQIGMAHRGRLNVLHNLLGKPFGEVCAEMEGHQSSFRVGDVKYHLGHTVERQLCSGDDMKISVAPNPSHLEMIHPVVQGLVRSLQRHRCRACCSVVTPACLPCAGC